MTHNVGVLMRDTSAKLLVDCLLIFADVFVLMIGIKYIRDIGRTIV